MNFKAELVIEITKMFASKGRKVEDEVIAVWVEELEPYGDLSLRALKKMKRTVIEFPQTAMAIQLIKSHLQKKENLLLSVYQKIYDVMCCIKDDDIKIKHGEGMLQVNHDVYDVYLNIGGWEKWKELMLHRTDKTEAEYKNLISAELNKCTEVANVGIND